MKSKAELDAFCTQCKYRNEINCNRNGACKKCEHPYGCIDICVYYRQTGKKFAEPARRYI